MMRSISFLLLLALFCLVTACSEDPVAPEVAPTLFTLEMAVHISTDTSVAHEAEHPGQTVTGPFAIRAFDKQHDFELGATVMYLEVTNNSSEPFSGPVTISYLSLAPAGTYLLEQPDVPNNIFSFDDGDGVWSPGETSRPLMVGLVVRDPGNFVAMSAHLNIGFGPESGLISGTAWHDGNGDGVRGETDSGVAGLTVNLYEGTTDVDPPLVLGQVISGAEGEYSFGGLSAGQYRVGIELPSYLESTTPAELGVELVTVAGGVARSGDLEFGYMMVPTGSLSFEATADAMVRGDSFRYVYHNYGADPFLGVGTNQVSTGPRDAIRSLILFNPVGVQGPVVSARLVLTVALFRDGTDQAYQLNVHPIVDSGVRTPWVEGNGSSVLPHPDGVVPSDYANGVAWTRPGSVFVPNRLVQPDFDETAAASRAMAQTVYGAGDLFTWDITDLVNRWLDGTTENLGIVIREVNPGGSFRQVCFGSRDGLMRGYDGPDIQPGPRLVLVFE